MAGALLLFSPYPNVLPQIHSVDLNLLELTMISLIVLIHLRHHDPLHRSVFCSRILLLHRKEYRYLLRVHSFIVVSNRITLMWLDWKEIRTSRSNHFRSNTQTTTFLLNTKWTQNCYKKNQKSSRETSQNQVTCTLSNCCKNDFAESTIDDYVQFPLRMNPLCL